MKCQLKADGRRMSAFGKIKFECYNTKEGMIKYISYIIQLFQQIDTNIKHHSTCYAF